MKPYSRRDFSKALGLGAFALASSGFPQPAARKPNVVFILADDLGWRDTTLYGSKYYETPNIDQLAKRGVRFDQAYAAAPICSPTRASILTGLYPARIGIIQPECHLPQVILEQKVPAKAAPDRKCVTPNSLTRLKQEYFTLAEALKGAGYSTGHFGKWHLGMEPYDPLHQGFDVDVPHWWGPGPGNYIAPWKFPASLHFQGEPGEHLEDRMASEASKFIQANRDRPFYLNYWCFSVHSQWDGKASLIEKYKAKADPKDPQHNALYAAMVQSMDDAVGRLVKEIDDAGVAEHTIIVFFSDNGGVFWEPNAHAMGKNSPHPEYMDLPITSNAPLREGKGTLYEGGTREPCLVVWPGMVQPRTRSSQILQSVDFYPTILEMTGVKPQAGLQFDGVSVVPALKGQPFEHPPIFCHYPVYNAFTMPGTWVRKGDWKLIRFWFDSDQQTHRYELYNLKDDLGETRNLAAKTPEKVRELDTEIDRFLRDTHAVVPKPNPNYTPGAGRKAVGSAYEVLNADDMA
jgi:arylsulfatase A-like enzyme